MNKDLKGRIFDIPQEVLNNINHAIASLNGKNVRGIQRAKKLLSEKKVKYGQLKRIIHDIENMDKVADSIKYNLCGGEAMERWAKTFLDGERSLVSNNKDARMQADNISGLTGERKNSHLKKHTKRFSFKIPVNLIKSNSHKTSVSSLTDLKLFEELDKIKKLIRF
jgi:hypothetical protein